MATNPFMAFENETDAFSIGEMNIENRLDRVSFFGSLEITRDTIGLDKALKMKRFIDASIDALKRDKQLPDKIELLPTDGVLNPFV